jgi:hypothetical protein
MQATKNDLSYNLTKLDYKALVQTSEIAYGQLLNTIYKEYCVLQGTSDNTKRWLEAGYLKNHAIQLAIVAETLSTLIEGLSREELIVVNKPEVIKEV